MNRKFAKSVWCISCCVVRVLCSGTVKHNMRVVSACGQTTSGCSKLSMVVQECETTASHRIVTMPFEGSRRISGSKRATHAPLPLRCSLARVLQKQKGTWKAA
jgi:hypothetical protein